LAKAASNMWGQSGPPFDASLVANILDPKKDLDPFSGVARVSTGRRPRYGYIGRNGNVTVFSYERVPASASDSYSCS